MGWTNEARLKAYAARKTPDAPVVRGVDTNLCGRGLHQLIGTNVKWKRRKNGRVDRECRTCGRETRRQRTKRDAEKLRVYWRNRSKQQVVAAREEIFAAFGHRCSCCGITEARFLTLEHIKGYGGAKVNGRRSLKTLGFPMYRQVIREGFPKDKYTLLCMNCNWAERWDEPCPHKTLRETA